MFMGLNKLIKSGANERHSLLTYQKKVCAPIKKKITFSGIETPFIYSCVITKFL